MDTDRRIKSVSLANSDSPDVFLLEPISVVFCVEMLYELCTDDEVVVIDVTIGNLFWTTSFVVVVVVGMVFDCGDALGFSFFVFGEDVCDGSFFSLIGDGGITGVGAITAVLRVRDDLRLAFDGGR